MRETSPTELHMASADAIEDEWWLGSGEGVSDSGGKTAERVEVGSKRKRKRKSKAKVENVKAINQRRSFWSLHTSSRQRSELSRALLPHTGDEKATKTEVKKSFFVSYSQQHEETPSFSSFMQNVCPELPQWTRRVKSKGAPLVVVMAVSATRGLQLRKELSSITNGCVAKLFAKHMKIEEQVSFLSSHPTPLAVATPARLKQLIDMGAVNCCELQLVVLDWYWRDQKQRQFATLPEVWRSFVELYDTHLHRLVTCKQTKLTLF